MRTTHTQLLRSALAGALLTMALAGTHAQTMADQNAPAVIPVDPVAQAANAGDRSTDPATAKEEARELTKGDPKRWYVDDATMRARMQNLRKEIGAALVEAQNTCKAGPASERTSCIKEARSIYQHDMANARERAVASLR